VGSGVFVGTHVFVGRASRVLVCVVGLAGLAVLGLAGMFVAAATASFPAQPTVHKQSMITQTMIASAYRLF
jgi:hypothetical protein